MQPRKPIYSTLEDDPERYGELCDGISDFVIRLAEVVDLLQDVHSTGDFSSLAQRCREHAAQATGFGYPAFAHLASEIASASEEEKAEQAEAGLRDLADIARRIRLAHRGAA